MSISSPDRFFEPNFGPGRFLGCRSFGGFSTFGFDFGSGRCLGSGGSATFGFGPRFFGGSFGCFGCAGRPRPRFTGFAASVSDVTWLPSTDSKGGDGMGAVDLAVSSVVPWLEGFRDLCSDSGSIASFRAEDTDGDGGGARDVVADGELGSGVWGGFGFLAVELCCRVTIVEWKCRMKRRWVGDLWCTDLPVLTSIRNINQNVVYNELKR